MKRRACVGLIGALICTGFMPGKACAQVRLEPKFAEGTTVKRQVQKLSQKLTIGGMVIPTESEQNVTVATVVGKRDADGTLRLGQQTRGLVVRATVPGSPPILFDSTKPDQKTGNPTADLVTDISRVLSGAAFTLVLDRDNRVTRIEGAEAVIARVPDSAKEGLRKAYATDELGRQVRQDLAIFPQAEVKRGDTWTRTEVMPIGGGQTLTFEVTYEYDGTMERDGRTLDRVKQVMTAVKYAVEGGDPQGARVTASTLRVESSSGHYLYDRERGIVVERSQHAAVKGPLTLSANGMEIPAELDLTIETSTSSRPDTR